MLLSSASISPCRAIRVAMYSLSYWLPATAAISARSASVSDSGCDMEILVHHELTEFRFFSGGLCRLRAGRPCLLARLVALLGSLFFMRYLDANGF